MNTSLEVPYSADLFTAVCEDAEYTQTGWTVCGAEDLD